MPFFFSVARKAGYVLDQPSGRQKYSMTPKDVEEYIYSLFPEGLSPHGYQYYGRFNPPPHGSPSQCNEREDYLRNIMREQILEYVRRIWYREEPSRFESYYACGTFEDAVAFAEKYNASYAAIWEVECAVACRKDMNTLCGRTPLGMACSARTYWKGEASQQPFWEWILTPPVIPRRLARAETEVPYSTSIVHAR